MDREDTEHDLLCSQGPQQLYPLNKPHAGVIHVTQTLAAHPNAPLHSILSASVEYPEVVCGIDSLLTRSLHQGDRHGDPVPPRLQGVTAQHVGVQESLLTLTCPAIKGVSDLGDE